MSVQDVLNSSAPDTYWSHSYSVRQRSDGRTFATLHVDWLHSFTAAPARAPPDAGGAPAPGPLPGPPSDQAAGDEPAGGLFWAAVESALPAAAGALRRTRSLDRGDHLLAAAALSFAMGRAGLDGGYLLPVALVLGRLEALRADLRLRRARRAQGEGDERLKQVAARFRATATSRN